MSESIQHKLTRVRKPRVHITYDVHIGDAIQKKEIPYVIGILADLSGMPKKQLPHLSKRKFTNIDVDNINDVLKASNSRLLLNVKNKIENSDNNLNVELNFKHLNDFEPISIVSQVPELYNIYKSKVQLLDLLAKMENYDFLRDVVKLLGEDNEFRNSFKEFIQSRKKGQNANNDQHSDETNDPDDIFQILKKRINEIEKKIKANTVANGADYVENLNSEKINDNNEIQASISLNAKKVIDENIDNKPSLKDDTSKNKQDIENQNNNSLDSPNSASNNEEKENPAVPNEQTDDNNIQPKGKK